MRKCQEKYMFIKFEKIFAKSQFRFLNYLEDIEPQKLTPNQERILLHFVIDCLLEEVLIIKSTNSRFGVIFDRGSLRHEKYDIYEFFERDQVIYFLERSLSELRRVLPFPVLILDQSLDMDDEGSVLDVNRLLEQEIKCGVYKTLTLKKLIKFCKKKGLDFLTETKLKNPEAKRFLY